MLLVNCRTIVAGYLSGIHSTMQASRLFSLVSVFVTFIASGLGAGTGSAQETIRVMSYNIRYLNTRDGEDVWGNRKAAVFETIKQAGIVGLQEVVDEQLNDIRNATADYLEWYGVGRNDGKTSGEAAPVGWNPNKFELREKGTFWLSPQPDRIGSKGWDAALPRIASWVLLRAKHIDGNPELLFLNTHFDHRGKKARERSAELIRDWLKRKIAENTNLPVVVTGDFNARLNDAPMKAVLAEVDGWRLKNARTESETPDPGPDSTWCGFSKIVPNRRIDFVLVAGAIQVKKFMTLNPKTVAGRFASDHLPVTAELQLSQ